MAGNTATPGASVLSRAFTVLAAFGPEQRRLSLSALSRHAGLPLATTHRLVGELVREGALTRTADGEYVVGQRIWDLGLLAPVQTGLQQVASPFLHDIYAATLATVHLAVRENVEVLYLARLSGNRSVPVVSSVGSRLPLHATGVGKVLLAHAPKDIREQAMSNLSRITPYTITQPGKLEDQLSRVLRDGYATTVEEMSLGACSVAVPITRTLHGRQQVVASLGIVVPTLKRDRPRLVAALQVAAQGISRNLNLHPGTERAGL